MARVSPSLSDRLKDALCIAWGIFVMFCVYLVICFAVAAFLAMLAGADWVAAGMANVKHHLSMWRDLLCNR